MYLVPDDLMEAFVVSVAAKTDEPMLFRKGEPTLVAGIGEVYQDYMLLTLPQAMEEAEYGLPDVEDAYGDPQEVEMDGPSEEDEGHTCDCE